jgi:hypothetical protein
MTRKYITKKYKIKNKIHYTKNRNRSVGGAISGANSNPYTKIAYDMVTGIIYFFLTALSLPLKTVDQIIPINLCKKLTSKNNKICTNKLSEFFITGSKKKDDEEKINLPESCIKINEHNQSVKCKPNNSITGGSNSLSNIKKTYGQKIIKKLSKIGISTAVKLADSPSVIANAVSPVTTIIKNKATNLASGASTLTSKGIYSTGKFISSTSDKTAKLGSKIKYTIKNGINDFYVSKHKNDRLEIIKKKLKQLIIFLRQYKSPEKKMISIINKINDIEILQKVKGIYETYILLGKTADNKPDYGTGNYIDYKNQDDNSCDNVDLQLQNTNPDIEYYDFTPLIDENSLTDKCHDCTSTKSAFSLFNNYKRQLQYLFEGNRKNNINNLIINIIHEIIILKDKSFLYKVPINNSVNNLNNEIIKLLKSINCRCNIIKIINDRINDIKKLKTI